MDSHPHDAKFESVDRRNFLCQSAVATATALVATGLGLAAEPQTAAGKPADFKRKIKLGVVGCGGRGSWIAKLFQQHGGYEMYGVADYFQEVADRCGDALGVDKGRRFSGLSGYKKLMASGIEAIALENLPYFFPEQARAAVDAGLHVYMAKPVASDAPGCLAVEAASKLATQKKQCFLVDYQIPTDPINSEVYRRIHEGGLGKLALMCSFGFSGGFHEPKTNKLEDRLQHLLWVSDTALGGGYVVNFDIHAIDAAVRVVGCRPVHATGLSRICRLEPRGDSHDITSALVEFADGLILNHTGKALPDNAHGTLHCEVHGQGANAVIHYNDKAYLQGGPKHFGGGPVKDLYKAGAQRNIATFYEDVTQQRFANPAAQPAVDTALTAILIREAAARHGRLTMDELLRENKRLEVDLGGLKV